VLALFVERSWRMLGLAAPAAASLGMGAVSAYAMAFTGYRILRRVARRGAAELDPLEACVFELGLGVLAFALVLTGLGALHLLTPPAAWCLLGGSLVGPHVSFGRAVAQRWRALRERPSFWLCGVLAAAGAMTCLESLAPVTAQDALVYHLAVPAKYVEAGGITPVPGNFFASFPQYVEMLFTFGLLVHGESTAQWFHWMLGVGAVASTAALARRIAGAGAGSGARAGGGLWAAALFATLPTGLLISGWAYVDLGIVLFVTLSTLALLRASDGSSSSWYILAAVFAGAAAGTKYTGGFQGLLVAAVPLACAALRRLPWKRALTDAALAAGVVACVAAPWWIRNLIFTGNPLFPFAYSIFGGRDWDSERAWVLSAALGQWGGARSLAATICLPWNLTFDSQFFVEERFDGMVGCALLAASPALIPLLRGNRKARWVLLAALAHAVFWALLTRQIRFLLPALALVAAALGAALSESGAPRRLRRALAPTVLIGVALNVVIHAFHFAHHDPLPVLLGLETREAYLTREIPGGDYPVFERIDRSLPADAYILLGSLGNPGYLVKRRYHSDAFFENRTLAAILAAHPDPSAAHAEMRRRGFTHLLFRFDNVFDPAGKRSEIPIEGQKTLMALLNTHGKLVHQAGGTLLYELQ
jgi:hypothetical protein